VLCAKFVALAFVPPQDVPEAFDLLVDSIPQGIDCMDEVVTYFEHTYCTFVVVAYEAEEITIEKHHFQLNCGINTQLDSQA